MTLGPSQPSETRPSTSKEKSTTPRPISASKRKLSQDFNETGLSCTVIFDFDVLVSAMKPKKVRKNAVWLAILISSAMIAMLAICLVIVKCVKRTKFLR